MIYDISIKFHSKIKYLEIIFVNNWVLRWELLTNCATVWKRFDFKTIRTVIDNDPTTNVKRKQSKEVRYKQYTFLIYTWKQIYKNSETTHDILVVWRVSMYWFGTFDSSQDKFIHIYYVSHVGVRFNSVSHTKYVIFTLINFFLLLLVICQSLVSHWSKLNQRWVKERDRKREIAKQLRFQWSEEKKKHTSNCIACFTSQM